ncbi:MAG: CPBP family glutamic-type intramembrane protease [Candidatus Bathyarchaeota archaeon]|nr:CPBP family glutamic-type intramembrane protease [Candidatus Bathyarchaeum sp.]
MIADGLKLFVKMFLVITVIFTVFFFFLSIVLGPVLFYFTPDGLTTSMLYLSALPVWFFTATIYIPIELNLGVLFLSLWSIFTLSFVAAWKLNENFHQTLKESLTKPTRKLLNSSLFALPIISSMTYIAVVVIQSVQEAGGIPTGTTPLPGDPFMDFLDLSYSAVIEEIIFRLIPIGAFLIIHLFITKKTELVSLKQKLKLFFTAILLPDHAKRMAGTKTVADHGIIRGISPSEWGMVIITSVIFGLVHFDPGVSWEIGKVSSATFAGLVIALCYLVYGVHVSILMHWFFNSYTETFILLSDFYPTTIPLVNAVTLTILILGILGWIVLLTLGYLKLIRTLLKKDKNQQTQTTSSPSISLQ